MDGGTLSPSGQPVARIIPLYSHLPEIDSSDKEPCAVCVAIYLEACTHHAAFTAMLDQRKADAMENDRPFVLVQTPAPSELGLLILPAVTEFYSWACPDYGKIPVCLSHCLGLKRNIPTQGTDNAPLYRARKGETPK